MLSIFNFSTDYATDNSMNLVKVGAIRRCLDLKFRLYRSTTLMFLNPSNIPLLKCMFLVTRY